MFTKAEAKYDLQASKKLVPEQIKKMQTFAENLDKQNGTHIVDAIKPELDKIVAAFGIMHSLLEKNNSDMNSIDKILFDCDRTGKETMQNIRNAFPANKRMPVTDISHYIFSNYIKTWHALQQLSQSNINNSTVEHAEINAPAIMSMA